MRIVLLNQKLILTLEGRRGNILECFRVKAKCEDDPDYESPKPPPKPTQNSVFQSMLSQGEISDKSFDRSRSKSNSKCTNKSFVCSNCNKSENNDGSSFYERSMHWLKQTEERKHIQKARLNIEENKSCTFVPKITKYKLSQPVNDEKLHPENFYNRSTQWKEVKENKVKKLKEEILEKEKLEMQPEK